MNKYFYAFYKINVPIILMFLMPITSYYVFRLDVYEYLNEFILKIVFRRANCDMIALESISGYDPSLYVSSYTLTFAILCFAVCLHLVNLVCAPAKVLAFTYPFKRPWLSMIVACLGGVVGFLALSTWSLTDPQTLGCSWFKEVHNPQEFQEQFSFTLLLTGALIGGVYGCILLVSMFVLNYREYICSEK